MAGEDAHGTQCAGSPGHELRVCRSGHCSDGRALVGRNRLFQSCRHRRADVIVPNSDLISGQVTNWTLGNTWGRAKVQVGVAYGSDVETVIETLLEVANEHEDVIRDNPGLPDPYVLFLAFGDSSLNFELRAVIRDVNRRLQVISDINRGINAAFSKRGIEIPFPQRDIHFRGPLQVEPGPGAPPKANGGGEVPQ